MLNTVIRDCLLATNPCNIEGAGVERRPERPLIDAETVFDLAVPRRDAELAKLQVVGRTAQGQRKPTGT
jgi:hypothetical protein